MHRRIVVPAADRDRTMPHASDTGQPGTRAANVGGSDAHGDAHPDRDADDLTDRHCGGNQLVDIDVHADPDADPNAHAHGDGDADVHQ